MKRFGYVRVSSKEQNTARQEAALEGLCDVLLVDTVSGKNADRPKLRELLQRVGRPSKIRSEARSTILDKKAAGISVSTLAREYGVSRATITGILYPIENK